MKISPFCKSYDKRTVLTMPEFELREGGFYSVIGANGSGKSTLVKVLAGIEPADGGIRPLKGINIGYMPQKNFPFRASVKKNLLLNNKDPIRAESLMERLKISHLGDKSAKTLSGGECQKMALGRLLMGEYKLLILDEPTSAMDMESTSAAEELVKEYCREGSCTLLLVTHSLKQAERMGGETLFFNGGELVEFGKTQAVIHSPQNALTQKFVELYGA